MSPEKCLLPDLPCNRTSSSSLMLNIEIGRLKVVFPDASALLDLIQYHR